MCKDDKGDKRNSKLKKKLANSQPTTKQLEVELERVKYKRRYRSVLRSTIYTLITVAAIAILVATLWLPVLQIYGTSMTPTLTDGDILFTVKTSNFKPGDIIAFYYNNKILVKRVIAESGDWVNMDEDGTVYVNDKPLEESYIDAENKAFGDTDIELPYQVPDGKIFVMGDHRATSVDSRNTALGCVAQEQIVGKIIFRIWPLNQIGILK
jgi:signal peptidase I